jgi:hypothetical protein
MIGNLIGKWGSVKSAREMCYMHFINQWFVMGIRANVMGTRGNVRRLRWKQWECDR